jgi:hypothetical protein
MVGIDGMLYSEQKRDGDDGEEVDHFSF